MSSRRWSSTVASCSCLNEQVKNKCDNVNKLHTVSLKLSFSSRACMRKSLSSQSWWEKSDTLTPGSTILRVNITLNISGRYKRDLLLFMLAPFAIVSLSEPLVPSGELIVSITWCMNILNVIKSFRSCFKLCWCCECDRQSGERALAVTSHYAGAHVDLRGRIQISLWLLI